MARTAGRRTRDTLASDPGQADQTGSAGGARKPGPGRQIVSQDNASASAESKVRPGPRPLNPTPALPQNRGSRAGSTIHSLPAEYALPVDAGSVMSERYRTPGSGLPAAAQSASVPSMEGLMTRTLRVGDWS